MGAETTRVTRSFDAANRLQTALDLDAGTTSYYYDDNGNLVEILPPGATGQNPVGGLRYAYDQRNMLVNHSINPDGTGWVVQAEYVYDGAGDRLQQVDHTGASPVTTTYTNYTNDVFGLTQVLVADDGTAQVYNLFGLDLISQDSGSKVRTLVLATSLIQLKPPAFPGRVNSHSARIGSSSICSGTRNECTDEVTDETVRRSG